MEKLRQSLVINDEGGNVETPTITGEKDSLHICIYTDGGCKPSRGIGGWGIHGYIYTKDTPKQGSGCTKAKLTENGYNTDKYSAIVSPVEYVDGWGSLIPEYTNNTAEMIACIEALTFVLENKFISAHIFLDSNYVLKGLTEYLPNWKNNNWCKSDGKPIENKDYWYILDCLYEKLENSSTTLLFSKVEGHSGDVGNDLADFHATRGVIVGRKRIDKKEIYLTPAKGYWGNKAEYNRLLSNGSWYFNTNVEVPISSDGRTIYHQGDHGPEDDFFMKPISDNCFSVVFTEPEPILERIRSYQNEIDHTSFNSVVIGNLSNILKGEVYQDIKKNDTLFLHQPNPKFDIYTSSGLQLTKDLKPARLAVNAFSKLTILENILEWFLTDPSKYMISVTEITDVMYEEVQKGKSVILKLKNVLAPGINDIKVNVAYDLGERKGNTPLKLTVNVDTPNRNTFSAITEQNPKVYIVTWRESQMAFRYGTIIQTDKGIGIWAGFFSNIHMLS
jgi:ribonuclease HI